MFNFKNWFILEARKELDLVNQCKTSCARATVVWSVELKRRWRDLANDEEVESISSHIKTNDNIETIIGLESNSNNLYFYSNIYNKKINLIPQEQEVNKASDGVKPSDGGKIVLHPEKMESSKEYGNYIEGKITIRSELINRIKAIGGCAVTCLHMSGGHVDSKTIGGYKKTHLFHTNQDVFYNEILSQYFKSALNALFEKCQPDKSKDEVPIDHYAIRLNGTTDIMHHAKKFTLSKDTIDSINAKIKRINKNSNINLKYIFIPKLEGNLFNLFDLFNDMWKQTTNAINCIINSNFIQFYDYTALEGLRDKYANKELPSNYHITFSVKEKNLKEVMRSLDRGMGVALPIWIGGVTKVNKIEFPKKWYPYGFTKGLGFRIVDGDKYDARFLDKKVYEIPEKEGYIIGLRAKGKLEDTEDYDSGFAERILLDVKTDKNKLDEFAKKYENKINLNNFESTKLDFIRATESRINPRFDPSDKAIDNIIYQQIIYTLRRNNIKINGYGSLLSKDFYDRMERKGVEKLIKVSDLDWDDMHSIGKMPGTSAKTDKKEVKGSFAGSSAKVEKSKGFNVLTNQTNMLPHKTYTAIYNRLEHEKNNRIKQTTKE